jgi:hypothetical protein
MDGSIPRITESLAAHPITPQRERRREDPPAFRLPTSDGGEAPPEEPPAPERDLATRPVAAPEADEPGARLDLRG